MLINESINHGRYRRACLKSMRSWQRPSTIEQGSYGCDNHDNRLARNILNIFFIMIRSTVTRSLKVKIIKCQRDSNNAILTAGKSKPQLQSNAAAAAAGAIEDGIASESITAGLTLANKTIAGAAAKQQQLATLVAMYTSRSLTTIASSQCVRPSTCHFWQRVRYLSTSRAPTVYISALHVLQSPALHGSLLNLHSRRF